MIQIPKRTADSQQLKLSKAIKMKIEIKQFFRERSHNPLVKLD